MLGTPAELPSELLGAAGKMGAAWRLLPALCPHLSPSIALVGTQLRARLSHLHICSVPCLLTCHTSKNIPLAGIRPA